jgi:hypothetical protein
MAENKPKCFVIMPITTPASSVERYQGDKDHFLHVLKNLFIPAIENANFDVINPISTGSDIIHAEIIKHLSVADLVLCDMSMLNPNVFFEFGIRTALDKPVALVIDDKTTDIPFDTGIINFYCYSSALNIWEIESSISELSYHIKTAFSKAENRNALWKYFGVAQTGAFKEDVGIGERLDLIVEEIASLRKDFSESKRVRVIGRGLPNSSSLFKDSLRSAILQNLFKFPDDETRTLSDLLRGPEQTTSKEDKESKEE